MEEEVEVTDVDGFMVGIWGGESSEPEAGARF
jgi:hypothetical protein